MRLVGLGGIHMFQGNFRINHAAAPMDDPAVRRVLWRCADQAAVLAAIGVPERYRAPATPCPSFFLCDAPLESRAGAEATGHDPEEARRMLAATSYRGQKLAFLTTAGGISQLAAQVMMQAMQRAGFDVEEQVMDWGTLLARRARREGWHLFAVYSNGTDMLSPLTHFYVSNTCADYPGWDCDRGIERALAAFAEAADPADRRRLAAEIQAAAVRARAERDVGPVHHPRRHPRPAARRAPRRLPDVLGGAGLTAKARGLRRGIDARAPADRSSGPGDPLKCGHG